jgi:hypothetical protein
MGIKGKWKPRRIFPNRFLNQFLMAAVPPAVLNTLGYLRHSAGVIRGERERVREGDRLEGVTLEISEGYYISPRWRSFIP